MKPAKEENQAIYTFGLYFDPLQRPPVPGVEGPPPPEPFTPVWPVEKTATGVRLTCYAPGAGSVVCRGIGGSMEQSISFFPCQDRPGYWQAETDALVPGFHYVEYLVDGVRAMNPLGSFGYGCSMTYNFLEVPGDEDFYLMKDVPHGTVHMEYYPSKLTGRTRNCLIYTPPGYETSGKRYPTLYLQHGGGENETGWLYQGKANLILDNLIAQGACKEMILVMNNGYAYRQQDGLYQEDSLLFGDVIARECVPFVESKYRTERHRELRAMAGLSMGGSQARSAVYHHLDLFANLGMFSSGAGFTVKGEELGGQAYDYSPLFSTPENYNAIMRLTFIACGQQDPRYAYTPLQVKELSDKGFNVQFFGTPGYHEWDVWRRCLREMAMQLFQGTWH